MPRSAYVASGVFAGLWSHPGLLLALALTGAACDRTSPVEAESSDQVPPAPSRGRLWGERVRALRAREAQVRARYSPRAAPPGIDVSGPDPYRIAPLGDASGYVGLLRGEKALVRLDPDLNETGRLALPEAPTALCAGAGDHAWVASRYGRWLWRASLSGARPSLELQRDLPLAGIADVACGDAGRVYVLPADGSDLLTLDAAGRVLARKPAPSGGLRLERRGGYLLESSLFERSVRVLRLEPGGSIGEELGRVDHDGPLWAMDAAPYGSQLLLAVAGVENKALVRAHGEFENIDSFVWLYRLGAKPEQVARLDVSDQGLVVPKAVHVEVKGEAITLWALAAGSGRRLRARWSRLGSAPELATDPVPPGVADAVFGQDGSAVYASPLFDAWIAASRQGVRVRHVDPELRPTPTLRLGEALFFTELMAPDHPSRGTHSRFSCETCHFEGGVDGRLHYTGRSDVSVVTKPLFGLANNRPHFSRALDPDLSSVCHNEFRVVGAGSGTDPWFTLETARYPWLRELGIERGRLEPLELRGALLEFLYSMSHGPNPRTQGRSHFSALEAAGARAFREHCESCHAARSLSDEPASEAPFADWEGLIFERNASLVWARGDRAKTGILPYVHPRGTRITSLRRLALKPHYFTNGSSPTLASVLARFRERPGRAWHAAAPAPELHALPVTTQRALLAFLPLL